MITQRTDYTFKYNKNLGRHGWLRLTPAYSVRLVNELLKDSEKGINVLDPFSGTATTGLVAAEKGFNANLYEINPFLVWFGNAKCKNYTRDEITILKNKVSVMLSCPYSKKLWKRLIIQILQLKSYEKETLKKDCLSFVFPQNGYQTSLKIL